MCSLTVAPEPIGCLPDGSQGSVSTNCGEVDRMANLRVLLVDDEDDILKLIGIRIRSWGYDFVEAKNGKEGIEAVKNKMADIVVLDFMLPDLDGVAVLKKIRQINKKIPVIMFTAYPSGQAMHDVQNLNITAFVAKLSVTADTNELLKAAIDIGAKKLLQK